MARPERRDCDYFPFYAKDGRTLHILEGKYECKGTGFFTNVMRFLTVQENHHFCIADDADRMYFFSKCKCDEESGLDMLNIMAKTCKIHGDLWFSYKVIVSPALLKSLDDAYRNRKNTIVTLPEILVSYTEKPQDNGVSDIGNSHPEGVSCVNKPQTKLKETKLKQTKASMPAFSEEEKKQVLDLYKKLSLIRPEFNIQQFIATETNESPTSVIIDALTQGINYLGRKDKGQYIVRTPYGYLKDILSIKSQNYWEDKNIMAAQEEKKDGGLDPKVQGLVKGVIKEMK